MILDITIFTADGEFADTELPFIWVLSLLYWKKVKHPENHSVTLSFDNKEEFLICLIAVQKFSYLSIILKSVS